LCTTKNQIKYFGAVTIKNMLEIRYLKTAALPPASFVKQISKFLTVDTCGR
jgi:hypothetical protein